MFLTTDGRLLGITTADGIELHRETLLRLAEEPGLHLVQEREYLPEDFLTD